jgi:hypothetical protein
MKPQGHIPPSASPSAHEGADLDVPLIARIAVILAGTLVALVLIGAYLFHHFSREYPGRTSEAAPVVTTAELPPPPRLQSDPRHDLQEVRAQEDLHLSRYAWVDRSQGIAQIPIERAMALWVKGYVPPPARPATPLTNSIIAPTSAIVAPTNELQMRQQKAQEEMHAH